jgi:N-acetylglucosamine malate deacetylase 1
MFADTNKILILAPHPDDAEFGLGGTISKLLKANKEIHLVVFSNCEKSTPKGFEKGTIVKELFEACEFLGISNDQIYLYDFEVRDFPKHRQEILEELILLRNKLQPDLVFLPCSTDIHQDHKTIHEEGLRAFKFSCLLGYELPWNNFGFTSFAFVKLDEEHINNKIGALKKYRTQAMRSYNNSEFILSLAKLRGGQIQSKYAESFELLRYFDF